MSLTQSRSLSISSIFISIVTDMRFIKQKLGIKFLINFLYSVLAYIGNALHFLRLVIKLVWKLRISNNRKILFVRIKPELQYSIHNFFR